MSFVNVTPDLVKAASTHLENLASALTAIHAATVDAITQVAAAAPDEVSEAVAAVFSQHAQAYETVRVQAAGFHAQFVQATQNAAELYQAHERNFHAILAERQATRHPTLHTPFHPGEPASAG